MVALDVQDHFRPPAGVVHQINQLIPSVPTAATLFKHDETEVPLSKLGKSGPEKEPCLINTSTIFYKYGYTLPQDLLQWLKNQKAEEVLLVGGNTDANVLAAGFSLFDAGFLPVMVPLLCYGNDWYKHTVTTGIWEQSLGKVYENVADLHFVG